MVFFSSTFSLLPQAKLSVRASGPVTCPGCLQHPHERPIQLVEQLFLKLQSESGLTYYNKDIRNVFSFAFRYSGSQFK